MSGPYFYAENYGAHTNVSGKVAYITLDPACQRRIYTCNDTVKGTVRVKDSVKARRVTLKFQGHSYSRLRGTNDRRKHYEADILLFSYEEVLFSKSGASSKSGTSGMDARGCSTHTDYAFEFKFPETVLLAPKPQNDAELIPHVEFEHQKGHLLPPSFSFKQSFRNEYFLEAEVFADWTLVSERPIIRQQLRFSPSTSTLTLQEHSAIPPRAVQIRHRSLDLNPEIVEKRGQRSGLARLKGSFVIPDREPWTLFSIALDIPSRLPIGYPIPLTVSFKHLDRSPDLSAPPLVTLRSIRIQAIAHIGARVPVGYEHRLEVCKAHQSEPFSLAYRSFQKPGIPLVDGMNVNDIPGGLSIFWGIPPRFKTYCLSLKHEVRFLVNVECCGKIFEVEERRNDMVIVPKKTRTGARIDNLPVPAYERAENDEMIMSGVERPSGGETVPSDPPPPYTAEA